MYGESSSGKSYTLNGVKNQPGLIIKTIEYLFKKNDHARYYLSYFEITSKVG